MKKIIITILLSQFVLGCSNKDNETESIEQFCGIYEGSVVLRTMSEIEEFAQCNYTEITGHLRIFDGNVQFPILSLSALSSLNRVGGNLSLGNLNSISTLDGLQNIEYANGLLINNLSLVEDLDPLDKLQTDYIEINNNISLRNIDALDMNSDEMITIAIYNHPVLESLHAFSNIKTIRIALIIENNDSLIDLAGLDSIEYVGLDYSPNICCGSLIIEDNDNLVSLSALNNLIELKGNTHIANNFNLVSIDGFYNLTTLFGDLKIHDNPLLIRFCGLQNLFLSNGHMGDYVVFNNLSNPQPSNILNAPPCN